MNCCEEIRKALCEGVLPTGDALEKQLRDCPGCQALMANDAALGRALGQVKEAPTPELGALFAGIEQGVKAERGPVAWLRSRPSPVRFGIGLLAIALVIAGGLLAGGVRTDIDHYPMGRMVLSIALLSGAAVLALWRALRPLHRSPVASWVTPALLSAGMLVPVILAAMPPANPADAHAFTGVGAVFAGSWACFTVALLSAAPIIVVAWALDRGAHGALASAVLASVAAGLAGNLTLQLRCPMTHQGHMLVGHAFAAVAVVALYFGFSRLRRRV